MRGFVASISFSSKIDRINAFAACPRTMRCLKSPEPLMALGVLEVETRMSVEVCILASGSSGNCTIVRCPGGTMLIDAGLGPRNTAKRMDGTGAFLKDIAAICLTHL